MYGHPTKHPHLAARAIKFTVKALKHGDEKGWIVPLIVTGVVVSLVLLLLFSVFLVARKKVVGARQMKRTAPDMKMDEVEWTPVTVFDDADDEAEYSDFN